VRAVFTVPAQYRKSAPPGDASGENRPANRVVADKPQPWKPQHKEIHMPKATQPRDEGLDPYEVGVYRLMMKLSGTTEEIYVVAHDVNDAVDYINLAYADMNVLYIDSVERLSGAIFVTTGAKETLGTSSE
jgi:hypothetical protein